MANTFMYYSKLLQQPFETLNELKKAEAEYEAEQAEKNKDVDELQQLFKEVCEAKEASAKVYTEADAERTKAIANANEAFNDAVIYADRIESEKLKAFDKAVANYIAEHQDGYEPHLSYKDRKFDVVKKPKSAQGPWFITI